MENSLATAGFSASGIAIMMLLWKGFRAIKGHRLVSDCCGKKLEVGVDVREMPHTPPDQEESQNPPSAPSGRRVVSFRSPDELHPIKLRHLKEEESKVSEREHHPSQVEAEDNAPAPVVLTISEPRELVRQTTLPSDRVSSLPPLLRG